MSFRPAADPETEESPLPDALARVLRARPRTLVAGLTVRRLLPAAAARTVGPFVFLDHLGPVAFAQGEGLDVPPHPHIGLATVTYLFEGEVLHRDSLGSKQVILPGAINWMTAGRGIVHSERTPGSARTRGGNAHGIQLWVGLPTAHEDDDPAFVHFSAGALPWLEGDGRRVRVLLGEAYGEASPVPVSSPTGYVDAELANRATLETPGRWPEAAVYVVSGRVSVADRPVTEGELAVLAPGATPVLRAEGAARVILLGGAPLDGPRHIWWNFVHSDRRRIEAARDDWREGRYPVVPGDEAERVPPPE